MLFTNGKKDASGGKKGVFYQDTHLNALLKVIILSESRTGQCMYIQKWRHFFLLQHKGHSNDNISAAVGPAARANTWKVFFFHTQRFRISSL